MRPRLRPTRTEAVFRTMVRFLHVADLHLGLRVTRFPEAVVDKIRESRFQAVEALRELAVRESPDFVLVAGDLFDDVRVDRRIARRAYDLFESFPVPVCITTGNHDPLEPGSVWDFEPWHRRQGDRVRLLTDRAPLRLRPGVTLFPCPVFRKTSTEDPLAWIAGHARRADDGVRIAIAHGSVMDRPHLPDDDHPIPPDAPDRYDLDYVALGHWHRAKTYPDRRGQPRMVYPGTPEPMRFPDDRGTTGWRPYSPQADREEFQDDGRGAAVLVEVDAPQGSVRCATHVVRTFDWTTRDERVASAEDLGSLVDRIARDYDSPDRILLRLRIAGSVPLAALESRDVLEQILDRFVARELDDSELFVEPTEDEIREQVGTGVLARVHENLCRLAAPAAVPAVPAPGAGGDGAAHPAPDPPAATDDVEPSSAEIARRAVRLLYRLVHREEAS